MNLGNPKLWIGLCSALAVLLVAFVDMGRKSPGPLTSVHQSVDGLMAAGNCADCHGGFFSEMKSACLDCHERIDEQMGAGRGLHGIIDQEQASRCGTCHSEHHGARFAIVNDQSFALAGIPDPAEFDHNLIGFGMDGQHLELDCSECHQDAEVEILPEGHFRYGGLSQDCAACHEDPHEGQLSAVGCTDCHSQNAWDELFSTGHDRVLPLVGGHAAASCRDCHAEDDEHALEVVGATLAGPGSARPSSRACLDCHASPHAEDFISGTAELLDRTEAASCGGCHLAEHESFREDLDLGLASESVLVRDLHEPSGFPLIAPHADVTCAECHEPEHDEFELRYPGRAPEECSVCHADPHEGQFEQGPFSLQAALAGEGAEDAGECTACHGTTEWEPHAFDAEQHELASLALTGAHLDTDCNDCHEIVGGGARVFRGTANECDICHADAHRDFFEPFQAELAQTEHGSCAACHLTESFAELPEHGFDHAGFAEFPILGAHAQESCEVCHIPEPEPNAFGRSFGFVTDHFGGESGSVESCADCHEDPHQGAFDGPDMPRKAGGKTGCARCHVEVSFRVFERNFNHERWTDFALEKSHASVGCTECHLPKEEPDEFGLTWGSALGTSCADCHADPHGGQFVDYQDVNDCSRCHTPATFSDITFRHDWDSTFELGEAHRDVSCSACHPTVPHEDGQIVRYKPLKSDCIDCHGVHEGQLLRRKRRSK